MFDDVTYEEIQERMFERVPEDIDKREGSVMFHSLSPSAAELQLMYFAISNAYEESFADTAGDEGLERRAKERGLERHPSTRASLKLECDVPVAIGTRGFADSDDSELTYEVTDVLDEEKFIYIITCEQEGIEGNGYLGDFVPMDEVDNLTEAKITEVLIPGRQNEDLEAFRQRYFDSLTSTASGGNVAYYKQAVSALPGIGGVRVKPVANGPGTVGITIINATYQEPTSELVSTTQNLVDPGMQGSGEGLASIDHKVTVDGVKALAVTVKFKLSFKDSSTYEQIQQDVKNAILGYLVELAESWANEAPLSVVIAQMESRILGVSGVRDIQGTQLNGSSSNLLLEEGQVPRLGAVTNDA